MCARTEQTGNGHCPRGVCAKEQEVGLGSLFMLFMRE